MGNWRSELVADMEDQFPLQAPNLQGAREAKQARATKLGQGLVVGARNRSKRPSSQPRGRIPNKRRGACAMGRSFGVWTVLIFGDQGGSGTQTLFCPSLPWRVDSVRVVSYPMPHRRAAPPTAAMRSWSHCSKQAPWAQSRVRARGHQGGKAGGCSVGSLFPYRPIGRQLVSN